MMWKWEIKQDKLVVARGLARSKGEALTEMFRYEDAYAEEDFKKMTVTIERIEK